jgi:hypothetical protein
LRKKGDFTVRGRYPDSIIYPILPKTRRLKIVAFLAKSHYLAAVMIFFTVAALAIGIRRYTYHRNLRIFAWYIAFSLLTDLAGCYILAYWPRGSFPMKVVNAMTIAFSVFEFIVCNLFILHYISSPSKRRMIRINGLLYFAVLNFVVFVTYPLYYDEYYTVPEAIFLVIPCLFFFYELFLTRNLRPLTDQPAFWVVTGILFLNACDIPLLVTANFMGSAHDFNEAYSLNYVLYSILFVLLIRAFLCPPEEDARINYLT